MNLLTVTHTTVYRYRQPVRFGEHRLMFRPRDSHDLRLADSAMYVAKEQGGDKIHVAPHSDPD